MLTLVCLSLPVFASAELEELEYYTITIGEKVTEITPDTQWYLMYNSFGGGGFYWNRDAGEYAGAHGYQLSSGTDVVYDGMLAADAAGYMTRLITVTESDGVHDRYYLQSGLGYYSYNGSSSSGRPYAMEDMVDATAYYVYSVDSEGAFALNVGDHTTYTHSSGVTDDYYYYQLTSQGPGGYIKLDSATGDLEDTENEEYIWYFYPVILTEASSHDVAVMELQKVYVEYAEYRDTFTGGTGPGECDADALAAFLAALDAAAVAIDDPDMLASLSAEQISQMSQDIIDTYEAVSATVLPVTMDFDDGYYFFISGGTTYSDGLTKGMYSVLETDGVIYAKWDTFEETCPYLWKVTGMGNSEYSVVNMATNATFGQVHSSVEQVMLTDDETLAENLMVFEYGPEGLEADGYTYMRITWQQADYHYYLHCTPSSGTDGYVVGGYNTAASSRWYLVPVSEEDAQAIIESYGSTGNIMNETMAMIEDGQAKMQIAQEIIPLITSVDQLYSPDTNSSSYPLDNLIDGAPDTYWRSTGDENSPVELGTQYIEVELPYECENLRFVVTRRGSSSWNHPTIWGVYGVPNTDAEKDDCTFLAELETTYESKGETVISRSFDTQGFTLLRFYFEDTSGSDAAGNKYGYTHIAEFQLYETAKDLVTSVDQLSSPDTYSASYPLDHLIDGRSDTYWRTDGSSDAPVESGTQYLQVEVPSVYDQLYFTLLRRDGTSYHPIQWGVYGAPSASAEKDRCTLLAEIETPYNNPGESVTSEPFDTQGFTIFRFYINKTNTSSGTSRIAEFQLHEYKEGSITQKDVLGSIYTDLEEAIGVATSELSNGSVSEETYNALKEAYDAFIAAFVDPSELRIVLTEADKLAKGFIIGTDPGYWSESSTADALNATITDANSYDKSKTYTQTQTDTYLETLQSQMDAVNDAAIKIQPGKWYEIRYATVDEINDNGWYYSAGAKTDTSDELFGKYLAVANLLWDGVYVVDPYEKSDLESICVDQNLYFLDHGSIIYEDYAKFRFINVGDTAYMIQNKATGLFLKAVSRNLYVTLTPHPALFNVSAQGYGENLISGVRIDGYNLYNLYARVSRNILGTSSTTGAGTNSGLYIEDIGEDVAEDYDGTSFNVSLQYGSVNAFCYPVSITGGENTLYGVNVDGTTVTLHPLEDNTAMAGQPFVLLYGDLDDYDEEAEEEPVTLAHGYDIEREAKTSGKLVGSYYGESIGAGNLIADGNEFIVTNNTSTSSVDANMAYIMGEYDSSDVITIVISEETYDSVDEAIAVATSLEGKIYSIDGKFLGSGNLNTVKTFGKGIYIINGVKVCIR